MKSIEVMQEEEQLIGYYSEDYRNRFLLKSIINEQATRKIAIIMINPKSIDEAIDERGLENTIAYLTRETEEQIKEINIVNLFPFYEEPLDKVMEYLEGVDMNKFMTLKYNLHMLKLVIKQVDEIYLAWGDEPEGFSNEYFRMAVRDVYHLIRVFNKEKNCLVFSLKDVDSLLNPSGTPFHVNQGEVVGSYRIEKMWIEGSQLKLDINDSLF